MSKTVALAVAVALSLTLTATAVFADDQTPSGSTKEEQATKARQAKAQKDQDTIIKATQDPQGRNISINKTGQATPEERAAARKARRAKAQQNQDMMLKASQDPQGRNANIEKSAEASKAGPTPQRDYINTPEAEQRVMKNKGQ
jgi:hypothetical protein